jgi:hypothetical protein
LRELLGRRILTVPRASARGSGPGEPPDAGEPGSTRQGRTSSVLSTIGCTVARCSPPSPAAQATPVSHPQQWLAERCPVLEDQHWLRPASTDDGSGVPAVVVAALEDETLDAPVLELGHDASQARCARGLVVETVSRPSPRDQQPNGHRREGRQQHPPPARRLAVEVKSPLLRSEKAGGRRSQRRKVARRRGLRRPRRRTSAMPFRPPSAFGTRPSSAGDASPKPHRERGRSRSSTSTHASPPLPAPSPHPTC